MLKLVVAGELATSLNAIHARHLILSEELEAKQQGLNNWTRLEEFQKLTSINVFKSLDIEGGLHPDLLSRSYVISPDIVVVDEEIGVLCAMPYLREDGRVLACGGVRHHRSGCPGSPAVPNAEKTLTELSSAKAVFVIQAEGLTDLSEQKQLHQTLLGVETVLTEKGFHIIRSWAAGPCRYCEPEQECVGFGGCRRPKKRRYSMEGSRIGVIATCDRIARISGDESWRIHLMENWGLPNQSSPDFKSVIAVAVN